MIACQHCHQPHPHQHPPVVNQSTQQLHQQQQQNEYPKQPVSFTGRQLKGAAAAGGIAGFALVGPMVGVVAAGGAVALAARNKGAPGSVARASGDAMCTVGTSIKRFNRKHQLLKKTSNQVVKGSQWVSKRLQPKPRQQQEPNQSSTTEGTHHNHTVNNDVTITMTRTTAAPPAIPFPPEFTSDNATTTTTTTTTTRPTRAAPPANPFPPDLVDMITDDCPTTQQQTSSSGGVFLVGQLIDVRTSSSPDSRQWTDVSPPNYGYFMQQ